MNVSVTVWVITILVVIGLFIFDFVSHVRTPHEPSMKESGAWTAVYIGLAVIFGFGLMYFYNGQAGSEFFAGYVTEKALSVDNLFVFIIIMARFAVPKAYQQKVLLIGIVIALILRGIFIGFGAAAINAYSWVFYLFGAFLLYTAYNLIKDAAGHGKDESDVKPEDEEDSRLMKFVKKVLPTTEHYDGDKLTTKIDGRRVATPMLLALVVIGFTDILFALDSIPAIYGLTSEPYIVFTANALALMGLRQLFFLIGGLLDKLVYLSHGLSLILAFIGVKLVLHALHENTLPFINGGEHVAVPEISTVGSLSFIVVVLIATTVLSLLKTRKDGKAVASAPQDESKEIADEPSTQDV